MLFEIICKITYPFKVITKVFKIRGIDKTHAKIRFKKYTDINFKKSRNIDSKFYEL